MKIKQTFNTKYNFADTNKNIMIYVNYIILFLFSDYEV
jgi:hypothetical protein